MSKFKKGARVRVVSAQRESYWYSEKIGSQYSLKDYTSQFGWSLKEDPCRYVREEDIELVEENKMKFDMKVNPWIIYVNSKEQFEVVRDWVKTQGIKFEYSEDWQDGMIAVGAAEMRQACCHRIHPDDRVDGFKEIVLNFKTVVDSVEWPEVETEAQKELAKLQKQIEELQNQANILKETIK